MQKLETMREQFGITQTELAMLLKVTRSQLSMYELGKRDLPVAAKAQLAEMLRFVQEITLSQTVDKSRIKEQELLRKKVIENLVVVNKHQQVQLEKKSNALERKIQANQNALKLVRFLEKQSLKKANGDNQFVKVFGAIASTKISDIGLLRLVKYQVKNEVLKAEEKLLEKFLQKL